MAAWYNGKESKTYSITDFHNSSIKMLEAFWFDLINKNSKGIVYFHNWAGYDSILSLIPLLNLHEHGYTFTPVVRNNQIISLKVWIPNSGKHT
jgi:GH18 family chitinase